MVVLNILQILSNFFKWQWLYLELLFQDHLFYYAQQMQRKLQGIFSKSEHLSSRVYQND